MAYVAGVSVKSITQRKTPPAFMGKGRTAASSRRAGRTPPSLLPPPPSTPVTTTFLPAARWTQPPCTSSGARGTCGWRNYSVSLVLVTIFPTGFSASSPSQAERAPPAWQGARDRLLLTAHSSLAFRERVTKSSADYPGEVSAAQRPRNKTSLQWRHGRLWS